MTAPNHFLRSALTLTATASAPFWARRYVADTLTTWRMSDLSDVCELIASELVTNAVRASGVEIGASAGDSVAVGQSANEHRELLRTDDGSLCTAISRDTQAVEPGSQPQRLSYSENSAQPVIRLRLSLDQARRATLVEVWDKNPTPPQPQQPDLLGESGRGLLILGTLCDQWGWWWPAKPVGTGTTWPRAVEKPPASDFVRNGAQEAAGPSGGAGGMGRFGKVVWGVVEPRTS
jgi:hypothetical protein